jgi:hypothetical protein
MADSLRLVIAILWKEWVMAVKAVALYYTLNGWGYNQGEAIFLFITAINLYHN